MEMKFAFIFIEDTKHTTPDYCGFDDEANTKMCLVKSIDEAVIVACKLAENGYNLIELCGAFKKEGAQLISEAVGDNTAVGYVIRTKEQQAIFDRLFTKN